MNLFAGRQLEVRCTNKNSKNVRESAIGEYLANKRAGFVRERVAEGRFTNKTRVFVREGYGKSGFGASRSEKGVSDSARGGMKAADGAILRGKCLDIKNF